MVFCKKCGEAIPENSSFCPACGCNLTQIGDAVVYASQKEIGTGEDNNATNKTNTVSAQTVKKKKTVGIIMCVLGCVLLALGISALTTSDYKFSVEYYDYMMSEYDLTNRRSYTSGSSYLSDGYAGLASRWKSWAEEARTTIWVARGEAAASAIAFAILEIKGLGKIKAARKEQQTLSSNI